MAKRMLAIATVITIGFVITLFAGSDTDTKGPNLTVSPTDVPQMINYQGVLTDDTGTPVDGVVSMTFTIYDAATGGNDLWTENHGFVTAIGGFFNVVGRIGRGRLGIGQNPVHQVGDLVKADGCTVKGCKIKRTHKGHPPLSDNYVRPPVTGRALSDAGPVWRPTPHRWEPTRSASRS